MARAAARFGRNDWIDVGMELLARRGPEALTLERLSEATGKTRGSFYHHFEDHQAFLSALAARWRETGTEAPIAAADAAQRAGRRRETLARRTVEIDHALERNLRRLAASEPVIANAVAQVDEMRIAYVARLFRSELGLAPDEALTRARLQHCAFVGAQLVFPHADRRLHLKLQAALGATLWRA